MNKAPNHFLLFKISGIIGVIAAVAGVVLAVSGFGDFESNKFIIGVFMTGGGSMLSAIGLSIGFRPEIMRMRTQTARYIQEQNKTDLETIASNTGDILRTAMSKNETVSDGTEKKFCKHCGRKIDSDSKFCSSCGKEQ